jgi:hypothetical protein
MPRVHALGRGWIFKPRSRRLRQLRKSALLSSGTAFVSRKQPAVFFARFPPLNFYSPETIRRIRRGFQLPPSEGVRAQSAQVPGACQRAVCRDTGEKDGRRCH